jgi:hypothetical protein
MVLARTRAPHGSLIPGVTREDPEARVLLEGDPELLAVVTEAVRELQQAFETAPIEIDYFEDPEDDEPVPQVVVTVLPACPFDQAHEKMRRVDQLWLYENMHRGGGRFGLEVHPAA